MTLERLQAEGSIPLPIPAEQRIPFAGGAFRTPSGKVEIYSAQAAAKGYDPVPGWEPEVEARVGTAPAANGRLPLLCPAAHHFISSTFGNQQVAQTKEGAPTLRIHPDDAAAAWYSLRATGAREQRARLVSSGGRSDGRYPLWALATATVWWPSFSPDGRNVNWTTSDRLADFNGGSTFYTNLVTVAPAAEGAG